jgi:superfamily II DNA or RNA helicase
MATTPIDVFAAHINSILEIIVFDHASKEEYARGMRQFLKCGPYSVRMESDGVVFQVHGSKSASGKRKRYSPKIEIVSDMEIKTDDYLDELLETMDSDGISGGFQWLCNCHSDNVCSHIFASVLMLAYGFKKYAGVDVDRFEDLFDTEVPHEVFDHYDTVLNPLLPYFQKIAAENSQYDEVLSQNGMEWWMEFLRARTTNEREEILLRTCTTILPIRENHLHIVRSWLRPILKVPNPMTALRALPNVFEEMLYSGRASNRPTLGKDFLNFLKSNDARQIEAECNQSITEMRLCDWLESSFLPARSGPEPVAMDSVEILWTIATREERPHSLCWQLLLTSRRMTRSPRGAMAITQLVRDIETGKRSLPPDQKQLLLFASRQLVSYESRAYSHPQSEEDPTLIPVRNVDLWMGQWSNKPVLRWADSGETIRMDWRSTALVPHNDSEGRLAWHVEYPADLEAGERRRVPLSEARIGIQRYSIYGDGEPMRVYVRDGARLNPLDTRDMPPEVFHSILEFPWLPVERLRQGAAGVALIQHFGLAAADRTDLALPVHRVPVKPVVEIRLSMDRTIKMMVYAVSEDGRRFYRSYSGLWSQVAKVETVKAVQDDLFDDAKSQPLEQLIEMDSIHPVAAGEDGAVPADAPGFSVPESEAICVLPDPAAVEPVDRFLAGFLPDIAGPHTTEDGVPGYAWIHSDKNIGELILRWMDRPNGIEYLGNHEFRKLLTTLRAPRLSIRVEEGGVDWFQVSVEMEKEMRALKPAEVRRALRECDSDLVVLPGSRVYKRDDLEVFQKSMDAIARLGLNPEGDNQRVHAMQVAADGDQSVMELGGMAELAEKIRETARAFKGIPNVALPGELANVLRPYQKQGVDFLVWTGDRFGGAILADDMGLGKTLQVLTALSARRSLDREFGETLRPSLVVCPTSVTHGWVREAAQFTPWLKVAVLQRGAGRADLLRNLTNYDIIVTNYAMARIEAETLGKVEWDLVCVDEAQMIKNPGADISRAVKTFNGRWRVALTGTPIENRLLDLWSISDFVTPGYLWSNRVFERRVKEEEPELMFRGLRARLRPMLLRRLKSEVAKDLPPRIEERRDCEMLPAQRKAYLAELKRTREMLEGAKTPNVAGTERIMILAALTRMRQICCDPALLDLAAKGSGKVVATLEVVEELLDAGHKILLFSQFVRMLEILEKELVTRKILYWKLTGQTTNRGELVRDFEENKKPGVFLISLKAGGTGLNLVSASHVILFDPWWNPAVEAQAIDRTHRIGQDKTVVAYRMVTTDSIEERILELQAKKRGLVERVLEEEAFNGALTRDDLSFILEDKG